MPDSRRFLHPRVIRKIARLDLRARRIVEGFLAGMHCSPHFGRSVEFVQHRQYAWGDDLRDVDWKVWAKQDRYYVKQYEADTNLRCTLLVDVSGSMRYGAGPMNKHEYACTIAACLAYLVLWQQDAIVRGCPLAGSTSANWFARAWLTRMSPSSSSFHICAPPAPQHIPRSRHLAASTSSTPGTQRNTSRGGS